MNEEMKGRRGRKVERKEEGEEERKEKRKEERKEEKERASFIVLHAPFLSPP